MIAQVVVAAGMLLGDPCNDGPPDVKPRIIDAGKPFAITWSHEPNDTQIQGFIAQIDKGPQISLGLPTPKGVCPKGSQREGYNVYEYPRIPAVFSGEHTLYLHAWYYYKDVNGSGVNIKKETPKTSMMFKAVVVPK